MQFGFRFQILPFTTSVRFSTKTLAYLAYKAFKAFKRWRLNPFQNYRSFSVDWPRTIRLVYASVNIKRLRRDAPGDHNPNTLKYKITDKRVLYAKIPWFVMRPGPVRAWQRQSSSR